MGLDRLVRIISCGMGSFLLFLIGPGDDPRSQEWPEDRHNGPKDGHRRGEHSNPLPTHALVLEGRFRRVFDDVVAELRLGVDGLRALRGAGLGMEIDASAHDEGQSREHPFLHRYSPFFDHFPKSAIITAEPMPIQN